MSKINYRETIQFLGGQQGNKNLTAMEKIRLDDVIYFIEQREKYFNILQSILEILFKDC